MADVRPGQASAGDGRATARAAVVLAATAAHWNLTGPLPLPASGWLRCPVCSAGGPVVRYWQFHTRPGMPSVPRRCDVGMKCRACAVLWVHGVAIDEAAWERRPRPTGLRALLMHGSNFEPRIWAGVR